MPAIVKKDGSRTEFDRRKIAASMQLALRKRPVAADAIDAAVARIEYQLLGSGEREVRSERLGELVMAELRELDKVAFVRFASVYRRFEDVSEFEDVIEEFRRSSSAGTPPRKR
jgi:transcriptional repressor NrdR